MCVCVFINIKRNIIIYAPVSRRRALTFAAFARADPVVLARGRVSAHGAQLRRRWRCHGRGGGHGSLGVGAVGGVRWSRRRTVVGHRHRQRVDAVTDFRRQTAAKCEPEPSAPVIMLFILVITIYTALSVYYRAHNARQWYLNNTIQLLLSRSYY